MHRDAVVLWWVGAEEGEASLLGAVEHGVLRELGLPVRRHRGHERPAHTFDPRRGQHASAVILRWLLERRPPEARKVLAITDVDLFIPVLTFVYGEALLNGPAAVVSTARLGAGAPGLLVPRLVKTCVHELGHTFGLVHCDDGRCVMRRSTSMAHVDGKLASFCPDCRVRYREAVALQENLT
jgi:archaemetzincin